MRFDNVSIKLNPDSQLKTPTDVPEETGPSAKLSLAILRGSLGFAAVSVAGFAVWACAGKWLYTRVGEAGLYLTCALVFVALSGLVLHPLVRGPGSLMRFYRIFLPAFGAYAVAWSAAWFLLRFGLGEWLGSLAGSVLLAWMIARGLGHCRSLVKVSVVVFALHSAGYFAGGRLMGWLMGSAHAGLLGGHHFALAQLSWGLLYGLGTGAGLGYAFFTFQIESAPMTKTANGKNASSAS
jgi:hypothetical protein